MAIKTARHPVSLACEIAPGRITAARGTQAGVESTSARTLSAGAVTPALTGENIARKDELKTAISDVLNSVGVRGKDVILVVPDTVVRVALLDFETLPDKKEVVAVRR